jgi:hypothetical protein
VTLFVVLFSSESNNIALRYFDSGNLLPGLVKCLEEVAVFGVDTAIAVGEQKFRFIILQFCVTTHKTVIMN